MQKALSVCSKNSGAVQVERICSDFIFMFISWTIEKKGSWCPEYEELLVKEVVLLSLAAQRQFGTTEELHFHIVRNYLCKKPCAHPLFTPWWFQLQG